jgi:hypothetical protein
MNSTGMTPPPVRRRRGFIAPEKVRGLSFVVVTVCLIISVAACILAIWDFTRQDTLWRTVATCLVIAGGMMAFGIINALYGPRD